MHGLAEAVERQRLDMKFDIGGGVVGRGPGEQAKLRRRHGQRSAPANAIVEPHHRPLEQRLVVDIERARAGDAEDGAELQMILKIFADPRQRMDHRTRRSPRDDPDAPTPGKLQKLRRADRARRQDDLASRARLARLPPCGVAQARGAPPLEQNALHMRAGRNMQVRPLEDRLQKRSSRAPAPPAALVDLEIGRALVVALVEVVDLRECRFRPRPRARRRGSARIRAGARPAIRRPFHAARRLRRDDPPGGGNRAERRPSPSRRGQAGATRHSRPPGHAYRSWR